MFPAMGGERIVKMGMRITELDLVTYESWGANIYRCPRCQRIKIERDFEFCPMCGAELIWE